MEEYEWSANAFLAVASANLYAFFSTAIGFLEGLLFQAVLFWLGATLLSDRMIER